MTVTRLLALLVAVFAFTAPARAGFINGSFESGTLAGWTPTGDVTVVTSAIGVNPHNGTFQAFLTTASDNGDANNFSGTDAIPAADLETLLGLSAGTLGGGFEGSALQQMITVNAGDRLTFDYKFLTTEGVNNDFAFVSLIGYGILADTTAGGLVPSAVVLDPVFGDSVRETGWRQYSFTFIAGGNYTLSVGVVDMTDEFAPSGLLVDNVNVGPAGDPTPAPEPSAFVLLGVGGIGSALTGLLRGRNTKVEKRHDEIPDTACATLVPVR